MGCRGPQRAANRPLAHQRPLRHGVVKIDYDTLLRTTLEYARGQPTIAGDRRKAGDGPNNDQASEAARSRGFANERGCNVWY